MVDQIEIYQTPDNHTQIRVRFDGDTVWLNQAQIVALFKSSKANISEHIKSVFYTSELEKEATVRKFRTVREESSHTTVPGCEKSPFCGREQTYWGCLLSLLPVQKLTIVQR